MVKKEIFLKKDQEYIKLGNLLKLAGEISTGGNAKQILEEENVLVNGEIETRRGRKLRKGDEVTIASSTYVVLAP